MSGKRPRALELLRHSRDRLSLLKEHLDAMPFASAEDLAAAQGDPHNYEPYRDFDFIVHQLDLSAEGVRQICEMGQQEVLDALDKHVDGHVSDFIALHKHLFHTYDGIDVDDLWGTVCEDVPMMIGAIDQALEDLERENAGDNARAE